MLSENWYYSSELRVLNTQLIFAPLFLIFSDWHAVRMVGTVILYLIYLLCIYYFCRQCGLRGQFPLIAGVFFLPVSAYYFCYVLGHVYYIPHICISLGMFGMLFAFSQKPQRWLRVLLVLVASALSVLAGMGGLRQLLVFYLPIALCALMELFLMGKPLVFSDEAGGERDSASSSSEIHAGQRLRFSLLALWSALLSGVGYLINSKVLSNIYSFRDYGDIAFASFSFDNIITVLNGLLSCLGYRTDVEVLSKWLPINILALLLVLLIFVATWDCLKNAKAYAWEIRIIALFFVFASTAFVGVYAFTDMAESRWSVRYWLPILVFAAPIVASYLKKLGARFRMPRLKSVMVAALCMVLAIGSAANYYMALKQGYIQRAMSASTSELGEISSLLSEAGYTYGYSTRSQANTLTELSDGTLDVIEITESTTTDFTSIDHWLQLKSHSTVIPEGQVFCIFTPYQCANYEVVQALSDEHIIYESDNYIVFGYKSYDQLIEDANDG